MINQNGISSEIRYAEPGKEKKTDGAVFLLGVMVNAVRNDIFSISSISACMSLGRMMDRVESSSRYVSIIVS